MVYKNHNFTFEYQSVKLQGKYVDFNLHPVSGLKAFIHTDQVVVFLTGIICIKTDISMFYYHAFLT